MNHRPSGLAQRTPRRTEVFEHQQFAPWEAFVGEDRTRRRAERNFAEGQWVAVKFAAGEVQRRAQGGAFAESGAGGEAGRKRGAGGGAQCGGGREVEGA